MTATTHPVNLEDYVIYDIETYPNVFTLTLCNASAMHRALENNQPIPYRSYRLSTLDTYEVYRNNLSALRQVIRMSKERYWVGFNNVKFDAVVVDVLADKLKQFDNLAQHDIVTALYNKADEIINDEEYKHKYYLIPFKPQLDLYMIHHFDNASKRTSLKMLEFNMRLPSIQELPFEPGIDIPLDGLDTLITYNQHDVLATYHLFMDSLDMIAFRHTMTEKMDGNYTNFNDTKIGKEYMIEKLGRKNCYQKGWQPIQTLRRRVNVKDILFHDQLDFTQSAFNAITDFFKALTLRSTKGAFSQLDEASIRHLKPYMSLHTTATIKKRQRSIALLDAHFATGETDLPPVPPLLKGMAAFFKRYRDHRLNDQPLDDKIIGDVRSLNVNVQGLTYEFGTGGLHASHKEVLYESDDDHIIIDLDVTSYYPSLAIENDMHPAHFNKKQWCDLYAGIKTQRAKYAKGTAENAMLKLALNGTYGDSNNQYSPFYDWQYTMQTCINGQLLLCVLVDKLLNRINNLEVIQANTDGITVILPRSAKGTLDQVVKEWEELTHLDLEYAYYSRMAIKDVNNYIAFYEGSDNVKRKGVYEYDLQLHQNHSNLIIPKAAEHAIRHNVHPAQFIRDHKDIYDFMSRTKLTRTSTLAGIKQDGDTLALPRITRYVITYDDHDLGLQLVKSMPMTKSQCLSAGVTKGMKQIRVESGLRVIDQTDVTESGLIDPREINYDYYIREAFKLTHFATDYSRTPWG